MFRLRTRCGGGGCGGHCKTTLASATCVCACPLHPWSPPATLCHSVSFVSLWCAYAVVLQVGLTPLQAGVCFGKTVDVVRLVLDAGGSPYALAFGAPTTLGASLVTCNWTAAPWGVGGSVHVNQVPPPPLQQGVALLIFFCVCVQMVGQGQGQGPGPQVAPAAAAAAAAAAAERPRLAGVLAVVDPCLMVWLCRTVLSRCWRCVPSTPAPLSRWR